MSYAAFVGKDASGDLLVTYIAAAADPMGARSSADIIGGYSAEFGEPRWARASDMFAFDSWSALSSSVGSNTGSLCLIDRNKFNLRL